MFDAEKKIFLNRISALEEALDDLRRENNALKADMNFRGDFPLCLKLSRSESDILGFILKKEIVSRSAIYQILYSEKKTVDGVGYRTIDTFVCTLRKKLKLHGIIIDTHYCLGYSMSKENKEKVKQLISKEKGIAAWAREF